MKIQMTLLLSLMPSIWSIYAMDAKHLLEKRKFAYLVTPWGSQHEFQINLKENATDLSAKPISVYNDLLDKIPAIGHYSNEYPLTKRYALIELDPQMIKNLMPANLLNALENYWKEDTVVFTYILISGNLNRSDYNLVFHPFGYFCKQQEYFDINVPMGIFDPHGIKKTSNSSIPFETLKEVNVNAHNGNGMHFSPNNAQFAITNNSEVSTFWSAAICNNNILITYHLMFNKEKQDTKLEKLLEKTETMNDLLKSLKLIEEEFSTHEDRQMLNNALDTIYNILNWQAPEPSSFSLLNDLNDLKVNLEALSNLL